MSEPLFPVGSVVKHIKNGYNITISSYQYCGMCNQWEYSYKDSDGKEWKGNSKKYIEKNYVFLTPPKIYTIEECL